MFKMKDNYLVVDENTISYSSNWSPSISISWKDIGNIKSRDLPTQELVLYDVSGKKIIKISYHFQKFDRLLEIIIEKASHLKNLYSYQKTFYISPAFTIGWLIISSFFLFLTIYGMVNSNDAAWSLFMLITLLCLTPLILSAWKVYLNEDDIKISYPLRKIKIPYSSISDIYLKNMKGKIYGVGNLYATVFVELNTGKILKFSTFREGSFSLFSALKSTWESKSILK
jgi:hypothetical protein